MAHALLLSPDDQAVSAITGVLEEMSVTCERPLDGSTAAKKLNSQSFDLVLVDCENLPAAKLIFDVCRRPKTGGNPVPIAIVDGRAGLPTAFRLGAELILTKPVAKDQARTTIRTAVNRIRKEESARPAHLFEETPVAPPPASETPAPRAQAAAAGVSASPATQVEATPPIKPPLSPAESPRAPVVKALAPVEELSTTPAPPKVAPPVARDLTPPQSFAPPKLPAPPPPPVSKPSDDPILADLEGDAPTPVFSSYHETRPKKNGRASLLLLLLLMLGGGFYVAWRYQPGFREVVQPWIDLVVGAIHTPGQSRIQAPSQPVAESEPLNKPVESAASASTDSATASQNGSAASSPVAESNPTAIPGSTSASTTPGETAASPAKKAAGQSLDDEAEVTKNEQKNDTAKKLVAAVPSDELPGEKDAIILSSQGAEKRLLHHVPPTYPAEARRERLEGTVVLKAIVGESGKVAGVRLVEGNPTLATAAIQAVKQWQYRPYLRNGKALSFQTIVLVEFQRY